MKKNNGLIFSTPLLMIAISLGGCGDVEDVVKVEESTVRPVKTFTIQRTTESKKWEFPSTIKANKSTNLSFKNGGTLTVLNAKKGQIVAEGNLLAKIDDRDFKIQLASSEATYNQALKAFERAKTLINKKVISKSQFDELESVMISAKATLNSDQKALDDTNIYAPFSGVVSDVFFEQFDSVSGSSKVITLIDTTRLKVSFDLPADTLRTLDKKPDTKAYVVLQSQTDKKIDAKFEEISLETNQNSQSYETTMSFVPPQEFVVLPGMPATVLMESMGDADSNIFQIPASAILSSGDERYVWTVNNESNRANKVVVNVKDGIGEFLGVSSGLQLGDRVIISGASYVSEGMEVSEWEAK